MLGWPSPHPGLALRPKKDIKPQTDCVPRERRRLRSRQEFGCGLSSEWSGDDVGWREVKQGEGGNKRKMWEEWLGICE